MPHLVIGIAIMLAGAAIMAGGLYVRTVTVRGRALTGVAESAVLLLLGLAVAVIGIIVSLEPNPTK